MPNSLGSQKKIAFAEDDLGLFIALTSMPFGKEKDFYSFLQKGYEEHFSRIANINSEFNVKQEEQFNLCYNPVGYYMWGTYDLATVCLIDDFTLSERDFHPGSNLFTAHDSSDRNSITSNADPEFTHYKYQTITGLNSYIEKGKIVGGGTNLTLNLSRVWNKVRVSKADHTGKFDFIGICTLKINSGLLLGTGNSTIQAIKISVAKRLSSLSNSRGEVIILDSFSWYEIVIVIFSHDLDKIGEAFANVREMSTSELLSDFEEVAKNVATINGTNVKEISSAIIDNSFLAQNSYYNEPSAIGNSHVFVSSFTNMGFNMSLINRPTGSVRFPESRIRLSPKFTIKPGHSKIVKDLLLNEINSPKIKFNFVFGDGDVFIKVDDKDLTFQQYFDFFWQNPSLNKDILRLHIRHIKSSIYYEDLQIAGSKFDPEQHVFQDFRKLIFSNKMIEELRVSMYHLRISKVLRERILRVFLTYNDYVSDQSMFIYFVDCQPLLIFLYEKIKEHTSRPETFHLKDFHTSLFAILKTLEECYLNRFYRSKKLMEVPLFNLDFNGGIHQIESAIDTMFKCVNGAPAFFQTKKDLRVSDIFSVMTIVNSNSDTQGDRNTFYLNYFHLFEPVILMSAILSEGIKSIPLLNGIGELTISDQANTTEVLDAIYFRFKQNELTPYAEALCD